MKRLIEGVRHFHDHEYRLNPEYFRHLAEEQHPRYLFITCCDSRIQPHALTDTGAGDLFLLRNIGNIVPPAPVVRSDVEAAVEYALAALNVAHIILCGHSHCGAMHALLHPEHLKELPAVREWLENARETHDRTMARHGHLDHDALLEAMVEENVIVQLERLRDLPCVRQRLADGRVQIHGWVYKIEEGDIVTYRPESGQFVPLGLPEETLG